MTSYRQKPAVVEAHQWFKNGDHPADNCRLITPTRPGVTESFLSEGEIVRYYRNPDDSGDRECGDCGETMHQHGWIDQGALGRVVCPGDWVISLPVESVGRVACFPVKPDVFQATYEAVPEVTS
jgi:hypothetical protein